MDLDDRIGDAGLIFASEGEAGFRVREAVALQAVADEEDVVLALGGGSVNEGSAPLRAWARLVLMATVPTLLERVGSGVGRPMLGGDVAARVRELHARRVAGWTAFGLCIHTDGLTAAQVVERAQAAW